MRKLVLYCLVAVLIAATGITLLVWDDLSVFTQGVLALATVAMFGGTAFASWLFGAVGKAMESLEQR